MSKIEAVGNFFTVPDTTSWKISDRSDNSNDQKESSFGDQLIGFIKEVNQSQNSSSQLQNDYLAGKKVEPHELMMSMEKASMMLNLTVKVRDDIVKTWNDLARTS